MATSFVDTPSASGYDEGKFLVFWEVAVVSLSERRKQFLRSLIDLYRRTQLPVHYATLAKLIGVSKWTAYDMLTELERQGFLTRDYAVNPGAVGRSQIVFVPTHQAEALFAKPRTPVLSEADLNAIKDQALQLLHQLNGVNPAEAIQRILREIPKVEARVTFCAYLMGLLLIYLRSLGEGPAGVVRRLVRHAPGREMRLTLFVGTVVGTAIPSIGGGLGGELADLVSRYLQTVSSLAENERAMLLSFLEAGLAGNPAAG